MDLWMMKGTTGIKLLLFVVVLAFRPFSFFCVFLFPFPNLIDWVEAAW